MALSLSVINRFAIVLALVAAGIALAACDDSSSSSGSSQQHQHHQRPAESPAQMKRDFLRTVDESISGPMIVAAPFKYVGRHVDLHCSVTSIPEEDAFNADCGDDDNGMATNLVVEANSRGLTQGQTVRVIGTVEEPVEGTGTFGGTTHFPTVQADFME